MIPTTLLREGFNEYRVYKKNRIGNKNKNPGFSMDTQGKITGKTD